MMSVFGPHKLRPLYKAHVRVLLSQFLKLNSEVLRTLSKVRLRLIVQVVLSLHLTNVATRFLQVLLADAKIIVSAVASIEFSAFQDQIFDFILL